MKIVLEWDGDKAELLDEDSGMTLADSILYAIDYSTTDTTIYHNNIKIKVQ